MDVGGSQISAEQQRGHLARSQHRGSSIHSNGAIPASPPPPTGRLSTSCPGACNRITRRGRQSEPARHRPEADRCAQPGEQPGAVPAERHHRTDAGRSQTHPRRAHQHESGPDGALPRLARRPDAPWQGGRHEGHAGDFARGRHATRVEAALCRRRTTGSCKPARNGFWVRSITAEHAFTGRLPLRRGGLVRRQVPPAAGRRHDAH